ncbi:uncharacterized protein LOC144617675 [Crassostrea virginica]
MFCANCGKEAIFYCCWNTSYCDYPCQQITGPPTCQCVCRPRTMPPTRGAQTLAANQTALPAPVPIATQLTYPHSPITWLGDRLHPTCWKSRVTIFGEPQERT